MTSLQDPNTDYVHKIKSLTKRYDLDMPITGTTTRKLAATKVHETITGTDTRCLAKHTYI